MADENPQLLLFLVGLSCRMSMHDPCGGNVAAHLTGEHDVTAIPLCGKHRFALVTGRPPFEAMGANGRVRWELAQISYVRNLWLGVS